MSRIFKILVGVVVLTGLCAWLYRFVGERIPSKVAHDFLYAIQSRDWETVTKFLHPVEKEKLGLTLERMKGIGENLLTPLCQKLSAPSGLKYVENPFLPTPEEKLLFFKDSRFFCLLRNNKEGAIILVTKTKEGWRVNFSLFIYTLLVEAAEQGKLSRQQIRPILWRAGIFQIFVGQEIAPLLP